MGTFRSAGALGRALGPLVAGLAYNAWQPAPYAIGYEAADATALGVNILFHALVR